MRPLIQKLPITSDESFVTVEFRTPLFEVGWHQHIEYELILFTKGSGLSFVGNHVGDFDEGDIYFLGSNLPHTFQKSGDQVTSAIVIQFRENCLGNGFFHLPESRPVKQLLEESMSGFKIKDIDSQRLAALIRELHGATGFRRIILLNECLNHLAHLSDNRVLSTQEVQQLNPRDQERIDKIFRFTIDTFREPVKLSEVASLVCMSIPAFCRYFKKSARKTYIDFLNEVRTGYACTLLTETKKPIFDICYESGYQTMANFHRQFLIQKKMTPLRYRKSFAVR